MSEIWGIPSPYKSGAQKHQLFRRLRNFNGLYLRNETRYRQSVKCVAKYKESPLASQNDMNLGPQTASNWTDTTRKAAIIAIYCHLRPTDAIAYPI